MRISIKAPSDTAVFPDSWRDARVKHELAEAAGAAGHDIRYSDPDLTIWLWGWTAQSVDADARNRLWIISHPAAFLRELDRNPAAGKLFERVFAASGSICEALKARGLDAELLPCPAPRRAALSLPVTFEVAFVGNASAEKGRDKLRPVFSANRAFVCGGGWGDGVASTAFLPWSRLHEPWNSAKIALHTTYPDMRAFGIMPDAVLDALANSPALVLHDSAGAARALGIAGPAAESPDALPDLVALYVANEDARADAAAMQRERG